MAPGGTNPGGKCPKSFSYFQTSRAMYFSVTDLQPDRLAAASTNTTGRHRAAARHHELARIESISFPGSVASGRVVAARPSKTTPCPMRGKQKRMHLGRVDRCSREAVRIVPKGATSPGLQAQTAPVPSALTMADTGPHASFLLSQLAAALAGFLDSHAFLQVVTDPECRKRL